MNDKAVAAMTEFLTALGLDLQKEGMERTPERVTQMYALLFSGRGKDTGKIWGETFGVATGADSIIAVRHIPFYSMCEHHLVPFFGEVNIAYLPSPGGVAGFSKFSQVVETIARRPQLQERLTEEIAAAVTEGLNPLGVLTVVEAQQLCMTMRGDLAHGTRTVTSAVKGRFQTEPDLRREAWQLLGVVKP
ncbi:MAG: GTP cyclohydrolase I [Selenomonadaceae bacterium]|nr:GTP cyclohydrolase I [Selenomonadaceae bacterium]